MTFNLSRISLAENESNDSAQSPAWRRNASPRATRPRSAVRLRASPANTSGGSAPNCLSTRSSAASSGHSGCCSAWSSRQDDGDQVGDTGKSLTAAGSVRKARLRVEPSRHAELEAIAGRMCLLLPRETALRGVDAGGSLFAHGVDRTLHEPASGFGGDAELVAHFAVAALAPVVDAEALLDGEASSGLEHVEQARHQRILLTIEQHVFGAGLHVG